MALSIVVNGGGTFSASMEEGPVSFTASLGAVPGPAGPTGATGATGVVAATAPILYDAETQTVSIDEEPTFVSVTATDIFTAAIEVSSLGVRFPDSTLQTTAFIGEARKEILTARNNTGSTIAAGKVVYLSGATGNKPTIALALASSESTSARTIGITAESIANNADGKVVISGAVENIDTSAFTAGQVVYLSSSTAGGLQTTLPAAPLHGVVIGIVTRSNPSVGSIEVFVQNYQELQELSDVSVADRANNDGLFYNSSAGVWQARTIAEVLGLTPIALGSLSGVSPVTYNSSTGAIGFDSTTFLLKAGNLSGLADVGTARTNLGLGSAATSSTSDFAAAVHTHTASAITDFNTAVPTAVPAASTTVAGKVELATDAEASAGTSSTLAVTPSGLARFYQPGWFIPDISGSTAVTSTGQTFLSPTGINTRSTATASGQFAIRYFGTGGLTVLGFSAGVSGAVCNYSKRVMVTALASIASPVANSIARVKFGIQGNPTAPGDLDRKGVGIRITGTDALELQVHDGTTLTNVTSSFTPTSGTAFRFLIDSDGAGNVTLFIDSGSGFSSVATSTAGPTGNSSFYPLCSQELESTGTFSGTTVSFTTQQLAWDLS